MSKRGFSSQIKNRIALRRAYFVILLTIILLIAILPAYGEHKFSGPQQTWPSRTPTSSGSTPEPPTSPPEETRSPENTPVPPSSTPSTAPTATQSAPAATTTATNSAPATAPTATQSGSATATLISSPETSPVAGTETAQPTVIFPTSLPCGSLPTVTTRRVVTVRTGPGIDYEAVTTLYYLDARPIVGRAQYDPWWLIQLSANDQGWVSDRDVSVQGYIGAVPVLSITDTEEESPPDVSAWFPTPNPICTPPVSEVVNLATATASLTPMTMTVESTSAQAADSNDQASQIPDEKPTESGSFTALPPSPPAPSAAYHWLLIVGIAFILAGVAFYRLPRRRG